MAFPDCDAAPDKTDVFKRGCREQSKLMIFSFSINENGTLNRVNHRVIWTCRAHAKIMFRGMLGIALEFKRLGDKGIKVSAVSLENGPVPWDGNAETFITAVEQEMRRRLSGL